VTASFPLVVLVAMIACRQDAAEPCRCTPGNASAIPGALDGDTLLARLRHHQADVAAGKNPRDVKMFDDELRFAIVDFCRPCGEWVGDRTTIAEMFPLERLSDAVRAVCLGLVLRDDTTVYGSARPASCR
jgi:hypothetical protein